MRVRMSILPVRGAHGTDARVGFGLCVCVCVCAQDMPSVEIKKFVKVGRPGFKGV